MADIIISGSRAREVGASRCTTHASRESVRARAVLVFVRSPAAGEVKTRLARQIGAEAALRVYVRLAEHTLAEVARLEDVAVRVHFTPRDAADRVRGWLGERLTYLPQAEGGLGVRLSDAFAAAFAAGHRQVVVVGSDLPDLNAALLDGAFTALGAHDAVLGPAADGGYYLLGLRERRDTVFDDIPWSTERVCACTIERLRAVGARIALLPELSDVDEAADLPAGWLGR